MKPEKTSFAHSLQQTLAWAYLLAMLGGFPFYFQNNYINIVASKKSFFQAATLSFLVPAALLGICSWAAARRKYPCRPAAWSAADLSALAFMAVVAISCFLSPEGAEAFWGDKGRQMGGLFLLLCAGAYWGVSRCYEHREWVCGLFLFSASILWLIMACNFWGWDLLGMHSNLKKSQIPHFLGTLGNQNINASYSGVLVSLMLAFYYASEQTLHRFCFGGISVLGIYACYCSSSDSWLLAAGGALLLLLALSMGDAAQMLKWLKCCMAFACGSLAMGIMVSLARTLHWDSRFIQRFCRQTLLSSLSSLPLSATALALLLLLYLCIHRKGGAGRLMAWLKKYGNPLLAAGILVGILAIGISIFPLEDSFGTNRGYIWKRTLRNFRELPFWQKLFGYGPNCFYQSLQARFGAEMRELFDSPFLDAHNEALQILSITGILGLASYLGMQLCLLSACLRRHRQEGIFLAGCVGITAYLLQGLVNNPSIFTLPPFFIFLGMVENRLRKAKSEHPS